MVYFPSLSCRMQFRLPVFQVFDSYTSCLSRQWLEEEKKCNQNKNTSNIEEVIEFKPRKYNYYGRRSVQINDSLTCVRKSSQFWHCLQTKGHRVWQCLENEPAVIAGGVLTDCMTVFSREQGGDRSGKLCRTHEVLFYETVFGFVVARNICEFLGFPDACEFPDGTGIVREWVSFSSFLASHECSCSKSTHCSKNTAFDYSPGSYLKQWTARWGPTAAGAVVHQSANEIKRCSDIDVFTFECDRERIIAAVIAGIAETYRKESRFVGLSSEEEQNQFVSEFSHYVAIVQTQDKRLTDIRFGNGFVIQIVSLPAVFASQLSSDITKFTTDQKISSLMEHLAYRFDIGACSLFLARGELFASARAPVELSRGVIRYPQKLQQMPKWDENYENHYDDDLSEIKERTRRVFKYVAKGFRVQVDQSTIDLGGVNQKSKRKRLNSEEICSLVAGRMRAPTWEEEANFIDEACSATHCFISISTLRSNIDLQNKIKRLREEQHKKIANAYEEASKIAKIMNSANSGERRRCAMVLSELESLAFRLQAATQLWIFTAVV